MAVINFKKQPFFNLKGEQMIRIDQVGEKTMETNLFMNDVVVGNLNREDQECTPEERYKRFHIAEKIEKASIDEGVSLDIDEISIIKKAAGKNPSPLVVGRVWEFLENSITISEGKATKKA